jgi:beta-mannosidase
MKRINLNGKWQIRELNGRHTQLTGTVPGVVHADLIRQRRVPDPFYRSNELDQQWIGDATWEYRREFTMQAADLQREHVILCCDGLDTLADVFVNDRRIASTDNMFIAWRWDVKRWLLPGRNTMRVVFQPVRPEMERRAKAHPHLPPGSGHAPWHPKRRAFIRKSHTHGGWDWGPCFLTPGIWRDIGVECYDGPRLRNVTHRQEHRRGNVELTLTAFLEGNGPATVRFTVAGQTVEKRGKNQITAKLVVRRPQLWWPNGYGGQTLYPLVVTLGDQRLEQRIGFRELELVREPDKAGESFYFRVNGVPVFTKGNNWIPSDSFDCRLTDDQIRWELESAVKAHNNMLRVWGGGIYERENFYRMCDELGLLIWQDFMFACNLYPTSEKFLESVRLEARHQVRRLQHHACLAMWCGNNENEQALGWHQNALAKAGRDRTSVAEYDQLYVQTIYPIVSAEDPTRTFWPSSPSNGIRVYGEPNDQHRGDTHYWEVWHGGKPFTAYLEVKPRFSSEFGFQSFAAPELFNEFMLPEDRNLTSPVAEYHQRSGIGNPAILNHISRHFRIPVGWENTVYLTQALQAVSIKVACEHWRRIKPHNMGTLIWQLNDIWPAASWSSLDCTGRWKMLHYFERKFYAPLLVSCVAAGDAVEIWGTSDIPAPLSGRLELTLEDFNGKVLDRQRKPVALGKLASRKLATYRLANKELADQVMLRVRLVCGRHVSTNEHLFVPAKALQLQKPRLIYRLRGNKLTIRSNTFTPFVWIRHGKVQGVWSDNGMHLFAGESRTLTFTPRGEALPGALQIHDLYSATQG